MVVIARQFVKYNSVFISASLVTLSLFYFMQYLIQTDGELIQEVTYIPVGDARMPVFEAPEITPIEEPEPVDVVPLPPQIAVLRDPDIGNLPAIPYIQPPPVLSPPTISDGNMPDSSMVPLIRTPPIYPTRALQRGIEGFVVVSFTVDELGRVVNPSVVYGEPAGMFDRSALQTIVKWKYTARIRNGTPIPVHDVQQRITYQMNQ